MDTSQSAGSGIVTGSVLGAVGTVQPVASFGIQHQQEPKYGVNTAGRLYNRSSGIEIPDDEPVFILRAKDKKAVAALAYYASIVENADHAAVVKSRSQDFAMFATGNPDRMREPTSSLHDIAAANVGREPFTPAGEQNNNQA